MLSKDLVMRIAILNFRSGTVHIIRVTEGAFCAEQVFERWCSENDAAADDCQWMTFTGEIQEEK